MTAIEAARQYLAEGWLPVPVPFGQKGSNLPGWQNRRLTEADLCSYFNGQPQNIGNLHPLDPRTESLLRALAAVLRDIAANHGRGPLVGHEGRDHGAPQGELTTTTQAKGQRSG